LKKVQVVVGERWRKEVHLRVMWVKRMEGVDEADE